MRGFLEAHIETSLFLLSNLAIYGPHLGENWLSGNYHLVEEDGRIVAVFCLTRRGNLLVQAGGRTDLAESILETCESEPIEVCGVVGEWAVARCCGISCSPIPGSSPARARRMCSIVCRSLTGHAPRPLRAPPD